MLKKKRAGVDDDVDIGKLSQESLLGDFIDYEEEVAENELHLKRAKAKLASFYSLK